MIDGPRGSRLVIETSRDTPLVWFRVAVRGGSASDPRSQAGFSHHLFELTRRGAGERSRTAIDEALDSLGANIDVLTARDSITLCGTCLDRNLDSVIDILADILARPILAPAEHADLSAETLCSLDDLRDDDSSVAARFFARKCLPGHPYARTALGNAESLANLELTELAAAHRQLITPANLVIGFAGAIEDKRACELAARLVADMPARHCPPAPTVTGFSPLPGRRLGLVDKPERSQSQVLIGHLGTRYGDPDTAALMVGETVLGGTFSSRLMQAIRVARGWSYGAGCTIDEARGQYWFRIYLAPAAEVTAAATSLALSIFTELVDSGITSDELAFATSYLTGSMAFRLATPERRMRLAVAHEIYGLAEDFFASLPERLATLTCAEVNAACRRWLQPEAALTVVVATAETMAAELESEDLGTLEVVAYDAY